MTGGTLGSWVRAGTADPLYPLSLAGYAPTAEGLLQAVDDLAEARSLLASLLADGDDRIALLGARAHLDARRAGGGR